LHEDRKVINKKFKIILRVLKMQIEKL